MAIAALGYLVFWPLLSLATWLALIVFAVGYWRRVVWRCKYGDVRPAIVVSERPFLLAVAADFSLRGPAMPVLQIVAAPELGRIAHGAPPVGALLPTICIYIATPEHFQRNRWTHAAVIPIACAVSDPQTHQNAWESLTDSQWQEPLNYLKQVPRPFQTGVYHISPEPASTERDQPAANIQVNYARKKDQ